MTLSYQTENINEEIERLKRIKWEFGSKKKKKQYSNKKFTRKAQK